MTEIFHCQALVHCAYRDGNTPQGMTTASYLVCEYKNIFFSCNEKKNHVNLILIKQNGENILQSVSGFLTDRHFFQTSTIPIRL